MEGVISDLSLFGREHLLILTAVVAAAAACAAAARRPRGPGLALIRTLAVVLAANELVWYAYRLYLEGWRFPEGLPLALCDVMVWATVAAALGLHVRVVEVAYYGGVGGSAMALATPDLWAPLLSYPTVTFFLSHALVVIVNATLTFGRVVQLDRRSWWRAFGALNGYTVAIGLFNVAFGTNYMFLCAKPANPSLLDWFGPWPIYVVVSEVVALLVFVALWLPLRRAGQSSTCPHGPQARS